MLSERAPPQAALPSRVLPTKPGVTGINEAAGLHQRSYRRRMNGPRRAGCGVNRKGLADRAVRDPAAFEQLAEVAKQAL